MDDIRLPTAAADELRDAVAKLSACDLTDVEVRRLAAKLVAIVGPNTAARLLGINRITALSLAAGVRVAPATYALIRERLPASELKLPVRTKRAANARPSTHGGAG